MVSMRKVEAVITAINGGDAASLKSRLQYLNLQGFPPGLRVGRARRADYGLEEIVAYAIWFSLTQASLAPATAMALISDYWPELARLFLASAQAAGVEGIDLAGHSETVAILRGRTIGTAGTTSGKPLRGASVLLDLTPSSKAEIARNMGAAFGGSVLIDFEGIYSTLVAALADEPHPISPESLSEQIRAMASQASGVSHDQQPSLLQSRILSRRDVLPRGERLSEADYYFARALELVDAVEARSSPRRPTRRQALIAQYVLRPSQREEWKRWVAVEDTGVAFAWVAAALVAAYFGMETGYPATLEIGVMSHVGGNRIETLAEVLKKTALIGRDLELSA